MKKYVDLIHKNTYLSKPTALNILIVEEDKKRMNQFYTNPKAKFSDTYFLSSVGKIINQYRKPKLYQN